MKVAFVDELSKSLSESELWQAAKTRDEVLFLFLEEIGKRNEISSRALKNMHISQPREDEKKDEKVEDEVFTLEIPKSVLRDLNYAQYQLGSLVCKLQKDEEARTLAGGAHGTLNSIIMYLEKQVQEARSQKSD